MTTFLSNQLQALHILIVPCALFVPTALVRLRSLYFGCATYLVRPLTGYFTEWDEPTQLKLRIILSQRETTN